MSTLLANLNSEQLAAVTLPNESALIVAGAGSGKTRVLTTRIAYLINEKKINPASIMAVTFTNKAAREMMERLEMMLPSGVETKNMWIGTFHSICNRFLRIHSNEVGLPNSFQIIDSSDQLSLIKRLLKLGNIKEEVDDNLSKRLQYFINSSKENGLRAALIEPNGVEDQRLVELYMVYEQECRKQGLIDFAELLLRCFELLGGQSVVSRSLLNYYRQRFSHIFVDEFQDTNRLQYAWLKLFIGENNSVFAVGDDDQSIYAFRGANVGNMFDFEKEFMIKHLIKLEKNYRSHAHILEAANSLIANNSHRFGKKLGTDHILGEPVSVFAATNEREEAHWVAGEIHKLIRNKKIDSKEIAILYRSNAQSRALEQVLAREGIAYRVYGGKRFFERKEIKDLLAYLRLLINPRDDNAFLRVVNRPTREIGNLRLMKLAELAKTYACSMSEAVSYLTGKNRAVFAHFLDLVKKWRIETEKLKLHEIIAYLITETGLVSFYKKEIGGQDRIDNLNELVNAAIAFSSDAVLESRDQFFGPVNNEKVLSIQSKLETIYPPNVSSDKFNEFNRNDEIISIINDFLSYTSLENGDNQDLLGEHAVQLMTVHAAKGLEFYAVFVTGLEEGLFPHNNSKNEDYNDEEERRLMYVAITRARERLYLSFAHSRMLHGKTRYNTKSRFLDELPSGSLNWLSPSFTDFVGDCHYKDGEKFKRTVNISTELNLYTGRMSFSEVKSKKIHDLLCERTQKNDCSYKKSDSYKLGQAVRHSKFGEGTIVQFEGEGKDKRARVHFYSSGNKWLLLSVAKLNFI